MKKVVFIMTHLGSGWERLADKLQEDSRIHVFNTDRGYHHPEDVRQLTCEIHRRNNSAAIWSDLIFYNHKFTMKRLVPYYSFIFWSSPFESCVEDLVRMGYNEDTAEGYYYFRLSGLQQYYSRISGALWNPDLKNNLVF